MSPDNKVMSSHPFVTKDDHRSFLDICGWFMVVVVVIIVLARMGAKWAKVGKLGIEDGALALATVRPA
jgi:hypothetical protein